MYKSKLIYSKNPLVTITFDPPEIKANIYFVIILSPNTDSWPTNLMVNILKRQHVQFSFNPNYDLSGVFNKQFKLIKNEQDPSKKIYVMSNFSKSETEENWYIQIIKINYELDKLRIPLLKPSRYNVLLSWDHLTDRRIKKFKPIENDIIKIYCLSLEINLDLTIKIKLPPKSVVVANDSLQNKNSEVLYVKLTKEIYKKQVICSAVGRDFSIFDDNILDFIIQKDFNIPPANNVVMILFKCISVLLISTLIIGGSYLLIYYQRKVTTQNLIDFQVGYMPTKVSPFELALMIRSAASSQSRDSRLY